MGKMRCLKNVKLILSDKSELLCYSGRYVQVDKIVRFDDGTSDIYLSTGKVAKEVSTENVFEFYNTNLELGKRVKEIKKEVPKEILKEKPE